MALTKISRSLLDTGVSDSSDATAITIDSSENVGIANTSPVSKLDVTHTITSNTGDSIASFGTSGSGGWANSAHQVIVGGPSLSTYTGLIISSDSTSGNGQISFADGKGASDSWRGYIGYNHASDFMTFGTNANEVMRIDSSGNVGIGTSSPNSYANYTVLTIDSPSSGTGSVIDLEYRTDRSLSMFSEGSLSSIREIRNYPLAFGTNNTERMRIDASGAFYLYNIIGFSGANSDVRYDTATGQIYYQTSSERYKSEITNLEDSLNKIESLRPVRFKDNHTQEFTTGLIAEEVVNIIPEVVFKKNIDGFDEPQPEGINYSDITPFLIKAIQEQQEQIEALQSEINLLKGE